jgi:hypothetical protein
MRFRVDSRRLLLTLCLLLPLALTLGCGDEPEQPQGEPDPGWSDPASEEASGSPDGERGSLRTAETLLAHLLQRVRAGAGPGTDPRFGQDVEAVAAVLWAPDGADAERRAAQVHMQLATTVGDVGARLAADPKAPVDDTEKKMHAAWLAAAAGAPDAYRAWCATDGAALLKAREEALRARLFKKR